MKLFAGFEADGLAGSDRDLSAGARIAADACLAWLDGEDAEPAQLDPVPCNEGLLHAFEDGIDGCFRLGAWESGAFDNALYQVLLDHCRQRPQMGKTVRLAGESLSRRT